MKAVVSLVQFVAMILWLFMKVTGMRVLVASTVMARGVAVYK